MNRIWFYVGTVVFIIVLLLLERIVNKNSEIAKKVLKIGFIIEIPILLILTIIKWFETHQFLGPQNYYALFLILILFSFLLHTIISFISKYFRCYALPDTYYDDNKWRYELLLFFNNLLVVFIGIATILYFVDDFIVKLNIH